MNIAVLGTGAVGQAIASRLSELGHHVFMGTRDVTESLKRTEPDERGNPSVGTWIKSHSAVKLLTFREAVEKSNDLIFFAMNGKIALSCLEGIGEKFLGDKILVDITNPLDFSRGFPPLLFICNTESLSEKIQQAYPKLKVVKSLNTMSNPIMVNPGLVKGDHSIFMSGNNADAKKKVREILNSFGWKDKNIIDLGDIITARGVEMLLPLWLQLLGKFQTPMFNFYINTGV